MLIYFLLQLPLFIIGAMLIWVPRVETLPFGLDEILTAGFSYFAYIITVIPPLETMYNAFLWVIGFKLVMKLILMIPVVGKMFQ